MKSIYRTLARDLHFSPMTKSEICSKFKLKESQALTLIAQLINDDELTIKQFGVSEVHYYVVSYPPTILDTLSEILQMCPGDKFTIVELTEIIKCDQCSIRRALNKLIKSDSISINWEVKSNQNGTKQYWFESEGKDDK